MNYSAIKKTDSELYELILKEEKRNRNGLEMIASENYASLAVMQANGSIFIDKYAEGRVGGRFYEGNKIVDELEGLTIERAKNIFHVPHVNVQLLSGATANLSVYYALCEPGDSILGQDTAAGGHLTHGMKGNISGNYFKSFLYKVLENGHIDYDEVEKLAREQKPKLIFCGASAYVKLIDYKRFADIANQVDAYLIVDIAHISGLIAADVVPSPQEYAHIITTTTQKTLRGPRGAMIMVTDAGINKDPLLVKKIERAVFPGIQAGPHINAIASLAVALKEAQSEEFKKYSQQTLKNAQVLAKSMKSHNFTLIGDGTENHTILLDLRPNKLNGWFFAKALDRVGIYANKNLVPNDENTAFYPSGFRLGTPAITTRGMGEQEMLPIADFFAQVRDCISLYPMVKDGYIPNTKTSRNDFLLDIENDKNLQEIAQAIEEFVKPFPIPGIDA